MPPPTRTVQAVRSINTPTILAALLLALPAVVNAAGKPNVLLIMTDQQHAGMLSCAGNPWLKTPALDRIAATGMRFERAYCANPVCVPSRFSMFAGQMPSVIGLEGNGMLDRPLPDAIAKNTMGTVFRRAGYRTAYAGKVHLPGSAGAAVKQGQEGIANYGFDNYLTADMRDGLSEACRRFLQDKHEQPFLLVASFINPHDICGMLRLGAKPGTLLPPAKVKMPDSISEQELMMKHCPPLPPNHGLPENEPDLLGVSLWEGAHKSRGYAREQYNERDWRIYRWTYARLVESVDRQIGLVLDALEESGLAENTVVVFTSDHGDMDGAHRLGVKMVPYEEAIRVPLLIGGKGVLKKGAVDRDHLVSTGIDLIPTLCDLAGLEIPPGLPGRSVRQLIEESATAGWRNSLVVESGISRSVLTRRYKYTLYGGGKFREQLVDLETDPGEMKNLAVRAAYRTQLEQGRSQLQQWYAAHGLELHRRFSIPP